MTIALKEHKVLFIVGPTAVGKTMMSLEIAEALDAEIVSADSRQVYRFMDIGTAKPTPTELARIPHHFIDVRSPDQFYSAGEYGGEARLCIENLFARGRLPVVVGGSGFYIQALADGLFAPPVSDHAVKEKWRRRILEDGKESVFECLRRIDPQSAARLHPNDTQRAVRALEVYDLTGLPISHYRRGAEHPADFTPIFVGLDRERQALYRRVEERVAFMMENGLVAEVRALLDKGFTPQLNALRTVGYQEVFSHLNGDIGLAEMIELIKTNSRRYAKRQLTWFRRDARVHWLDLDEFSFQAACEKILALFSSG